LLAIYSDDWVRAYIGQKNDTEIPHVFALARNAYLSMKQNDKDQAVLIR
jgi:myosin heavy subunit